MVNISYVLTKTLNILTLHHQILCHMDDGVS
jgi:hypothetical protein